MRRRSMVPDVLPSRRASILLALLALAGCPCEPEPTWDPPGIPPVSRVDLIPTVVYTAAGTVFELRARVLDVADRVIDINAYPQITIRWSSSATGLFPNPSTNPVQVQVPPNPGLEIADVTATVTRRVDRPTGREVSHTQNAQPGVIRIAPLPADAGNSDWIEVEYQPGLAPVGVLVDAKEGPDCRLDWALAVVKTAYLMRNLIAGCDPAPELAVFSQGREMVFQDKTKAVAWTTGIDTRTEDPLPPLAFRSVGAIIGLDLDTASVASWAADEVKRASSIFDRNRVGIVLEPVAHFEHGRQTGIADIAAACGTAVINSFLGPGGYNITRDPDLFVLFVSDIVPDIRGLACLPGQGQVGRVIYVSWKEYDVSTVAHEFGHTLSLLWPYLDFGNGHANGIGSFRQDNLMWSSSDFELRTRRDRLSLGQIFRMNLDDQSWLNKAPSALSAAPVQARDCQGDTGAGVCPALDKDLGEPGS